MKTNVLNTGVWLFLDAVPNIVYDLKWLFFQASNVTEEAVQHRSEAQHSSDRYGAISS